MLTFMHFVGGGKHGQAERNQTLRGKTAHPSLARDGRTLCLEGSDRGWLPVPNRAVHPSFFVTIVYRVQDDNVSFEKA